MKTPRDLLLEKHKSAQPKLDAIRKTVLSGADSNGSARFLRNLWLEVFRPTRRIWIGLAAVWVAIALINVSLRSPGQIMSKKASSEMMAGFREQNHLLAELVGPNGKKTLEQPKPVLPQPRSQRRERFLEV